MSFGARQPSQEKKNPQHPGRPDGTMPATQHTSTYKKINTEKAAEALLYFVYRRLRSSLLL